MFDTLLFKEGIILGFLAWIANLFIACLLFCAGFAIYEWANTTYGPIQNGHGHIISRVYKSSYTTTAPIMVGKVTTIHTQYHPARYLVTIYVEEIPNESFELNNKQLFDYDGESLDITYKEKFVFKKHRGWDLETYHPSFVAK